MTTHTKATVMPLRPVLFRRTFTKRVTPSQTTIAGQVVSTSIITGRVFEKDVPVSKRVSCYERKTGHLVAQVWSDENGDYEFKNLPNDGRYYYVVTTDGSSTNTYYNAVVQDLIQAV